ncbi:(S)-benzoin forming benzil reductase [Halobacillus sp. Marseille-Q1614]|uniref:(S)-benzoin forming benzil reductase n=1 Tax=Halobacillus sp. Marseille-Q1614 TaxID=2709134 RepID=UPI00156F4F2F|nr:(S)-benzoin forming benzil reductase [Halobacillus sp. Marseille-Q1614]
MKYAIITGDSRGIGEAIAGQFIKKGIHVIGVSRNSNSELEQSAKSQGVSYTHVRCDLSNESELMDGIEQVMNLATKNEADKIYLVNNAGVIEPINPVGSLEASAVTRHLQINVNAPILLVDRLLKEANQNDITAVIVNITSGAAEKTVHGWSVYSSGKAAINRFTETASYEQEKAGNKHTIIAFSPGVVDTDMQGEIRSSREEDFADVENFKKLKEEGGLRSPETVAQVLLKLLDSPETIQSGQVYKLYDLVED